MAIEPPQKFIGTAGWGEPASYYEAAIDRALLRSEDELVVDFSYEGRRYTATLKRTGGSEFRGKYSTQVQGKPMEGDASCRLYRSEGGAFLFGSWNEEAQNYVWWAELTAVERFDDEEPKR
jgi:hypothetical protein